MSSNVYIYDWCKKRGYFGRTGKQISHLLLDKGVLSVPENSNEEFLSEYAKGVIRGGKNSCIVEYKKDVFRMFYDLDIIASEIFANEMTNGNFSREVNEIFHAICGTTADLFDIFDTTVTMCVSNKTKKVKEGVKIGIHLTFSSIFVTTPIALHVRSKVLENLRELQNPFLNDWEEIVDAAVHKGSGMRLPWASKPDDPKRIYVPIMTYTLTRGRDIQDDKLNVSGFVAVREILKSVSLRTSGVITKLIDEVTDNVSDSPSCQNIISSSLKEYETVVEELEKIIPSEYDGKITGVVKTEYVYMFRHSSKFCANVKRHHHSSNTYFLVTPNGMSQCCYSRKDISCTNFRGELMKLPTKIINELFPKPPEEIKIPSVLETPSQSTGFSYKTIEGFVTKQKKKKVVFKQTKNKVPSIMELIMSK